MSCEGPFVAWVEDDDRFREEVMRKTLRELPNVKVHFSQTVLGFWRSLYEFRPRILVIDVMLPQIEGDKRLSEGAVLARWVRDGSIPDPQAEYLLAPKDMRKLPVSYADVPIRFLTGRSEDRLRAELKDLGIAETGYQILDKGSAAERSSVDLLVEFINETRSSGAP